MAVDLAKLPEALRDHGLTVVESRGWLTRGYDTVDFRGQLTHHTGGGGPVTAGTRDFMVRGRVGANEPVPLEGPLCNTLEGLDRTGLYVVYMVAGRRARHAGPGARVVWEEMLAGKHVEKSAKARGLPDDDSVHGNRHLFGREMHHPGGDTPWPDDMIDGLGRSSAAVAEFFGWHPNQHKGHKHWTRRKVDPSWTGSLPALTARYLEDEMDEKTLRAALRDVVREELNRATANGEDKPYGGGSWAAMENRHYERLIDVEKRVGLIDAKVDRLLVQPAGVGGVPDGTYKVTRVTT